MILVLRALGVGDLATAVPALRGLRAAFPEHTLTVAAPDWLTPLVELVGDVDNVLPTDGLDPVDWAGPAPYWAVNLHGRGPQSHRLLASAGPERLCGYHCAEAGHLDGPAWRAEEHEVRRWCRLLDWYGVECDPDDLDLRRPAPRRVPVGVTVVHPGGKGSARRWSAERFGTLARELTRAGHRVVVTGSPDERELARRVAAGAGLPNPAVLAGRLTLVELAAVVAHARLVLSTDTGVAHLATAYRTPSVVLFGPVRPQLWGPPPDRPWHRALHRAAGPGRAWQPDEGTRIHPALAAIGVDEVLGAAGEVDRVGRGSRAVAA
ncbi:glycosyltransferase family 9 protein [Plantactinospora sp. BB1]|uniref:glycosyltransferase family 9 protein n=1 Tax=Plantactinospora sp. BB1 TaxID=2071627 RepID=UPI000D1584D6|nr:glycosyltransferase family 9 protein [Plantactinospora sp. BB1]AVT40420.1 glycosyl transferase [Plantactinospora sp. BB1]